MTLPSIHHADPMPSSPGDETIRTLLGDGAFTLKLWPQDPPDEPGPIRPEAVEPRNETDPMPFVVDVSEPTLTVLLPEDPGHPTSALVVIPGGGYMRLGIDGEGADAAKWMHAMGGAGILLKHRVPRRESGYPKHHQALQDAQRAVGLVRANAEAWNIDPNRIGVLGFSAGGHLAATLSNNYGARVYPSVDKADAVDCRPNFVILIYGAYLSDPVDSDTIDPLQNEDQMTPARTAPTFLAAGQDDPYTRGALRYYSALRNAGIPAELHVYPGNNHGGGMRDGPLTRWPDAACLWLEDIDMIQPADDGK
jgi:acetyl esterase/lipase